MKAMKKLAKCWVYTTALLIFASPSFGEDSGVKKWKTFTSDYGYEFKHPNCWKVLPNNPDETEMQPKGAHDVAVEESKVCSTQLLMPPHQNGVGISSGWSKSPSAEERKKKLDRIERNSAITISRKEWLYFKRFKNEDNDAYVYVQSYKEVGYSWIRWQMTLFCPVYEVTYTGPMVKNPDQSYFDRFKAGDIALPEPERTIFDSIRCVKPKR